MIDRLALLAQLDRFAARLAAPLAPADLREGWSPAAQAAYVRLLADLRTQLTNDAALPSLSLSRGLDAWGVGGGDLAEAAAELSNALREFTAQRGP